MERNIAYDGPMGIFEDYDGPDRNEPIEQLIKKGFWSEKIVNGKNTIYLEESGFDQAKKAFLNHEEHTKGWILVTFCKFLRFD